MVELDIAMSVRMTIINAIAQKMTERMTFTEFEIVNQIEVTIITEAGPKSPEAVNHHAGNSR